LSAYAAIIPTEGIGEGKPKAPKQDRMTDDKICIGCCFLLCGSVNKTKRHLRGMLATSTIHEYISISIRRKQGGDSVTILEYSTFNFSCGKAIDGGCGLEIDRPHDLESCDLAIPYIESLVLDA
jgi:hypothetical protein